MRGSRMLLTSAVSLGTVLAATIGIASPAYAIFNDDYSGVKAVEVQGTVEPRQAPEVLPAQAVQAENQTLPVTGGDIAELAGLGLLLVGCGTVLVLPGLRESLPSPHGGQRPVHALGGAGDSRPHGVPTDTGVRGRLPDRCARA